VETDGFATAPATIQNGHVLSRLGMRDVEDSTERLVIEMDNRPDLTSTRGALQGGLLRAQH
jgi:acyl-coenzyme A thioesterase PaaI-like protein